MAQPVESDERVGFVFVAITQQLKPEQHEHQ
jgi:hypothetical protein